jgi:hypothetical protein
MSRWRLWRNRVLRAIGLWFLRRSGFPARRLPLLTFSDWAAASGSASRSYYRAYLDLINGSRHE